MNYTRCFAWFFAVVGFGPLIGCAPRDEISTYVAESDPVSSAKQEAVTLIAALVPQTEKEHWIFKVTGSDVAMMEAKPAIEKFLMTIAFANSKEEPITWKLPEGWSYGDENEHRFKSINIPTKTGSLDLSITLFGRRGGKVLPNVNRWREQIGRNPITEKELPFVSRSMEIGGVNATWVEMKGHATRRPRPEAPAAKDSSPFTFDLPAGWVKGPPTPFAALTLLVKDDGKLAKVTLTPAGGGLVSNLNRWRKQLGAPELAEAELFKSAGKLRIAGQDAVTIDIKGGDPLKGERRILGAVFTLEETQWFVKMDGPATLVEKQKVNYEKFATSLKPR